MSHLVGHEGQGSAIASLRKQGWATGQAAGVGATGLESSRVGALFHVTVRNCGFEGWKYKRVETCVHVLAHDKFTEAEQRTSILLLLLLLVRVIVLYSPLLISFHTGHLNNPWLVGVAAGGKHCAQLLGLAKRQTATHGRKRRSEMGL